MIGYQPDAQIGSNITTSALEKIARQMSYAVGAEFTGWEAVQSNFRLSNEELQLIQKLGLFNGGKLNAPRFTQIYQQIRKQAPPSSQLPPAPKMIPTPPPPKPASA